MKKKYIDNYMNGYANDVLNKIELNKTKLIESFVIYYGEEYRQIINERFKLIDFGWYINDDIDILLEIQLSKIIKISEKILNFLGFNIVRNEIKADYNISNNKIVFKLLKYNCDDNFDYDNIFKSVFGDNKIFNFDYKKNELYKFFSLSSRKQKKLAQKIFKKSELNDTEIANIKKVIEYMNKMKKYEIIQQRLLCAINFRKLIQNKKQDINRQIFGTTNPEIYSKKVFDAIFKKGTTNEHHALCLSMTEKHKLIAFNLFFANDESLIHEINHIMTESALAIKQYDNGGYNYLFKIGITVNDDSKKIGFEEILNQRSAVEITKIFNDMGGIIFGCNEEYFEVKSRYNDFFPLIELFYEEYNDLLKEIRITENKNLLFKYVDKKIYQEFEDYICSMYEVVRKRVKASNKELLKYEEIEHANELVRRMKKEPEKEIDIKEYLNELSKHMKIVKVLHKDSNDNDYEKSIQRKI